MIVVLFQFAFSYKTKSLLFFNEDYVGFIFYNSLWPLMAIIIVKAKRQRATSKGRVIKKSNREKN